MNRKLKNILIVVLVVLVSFGLGAVFFDFWLGPLTLIFGTLNAYYMAEGMWQNYIFGIGFSAIYAYGCALSGLYGYLIFTAFVYLPVNVYGLINWLLHKEKSEVAMKSLKLSSATMLCVVIIAGSVLVGYLLTLIPTQNMAFLDSTSQVINLGGVVLIALRFREAWYVWLANNTVDLLIWILNTINQSESAEMMLIVSAMYLIMNVFGLVEWIRIERKQKRKSFNT